MQRLAVNPDAPDRGALEVAARAIREGGVVALPTDTLYGLAVDPFDADAVRRLFMLKGRESERAVPLVAADVAQAIDQLGPLPAVASGLAARFWPGPLTLLVSAPPALAAAVSAGTGRVGVRVPAHAVARGLCAACGGVLTATSANLSGQPATNDPDVVAASLNPSIDVLLDAGRTAGGQPSTIVDVSGTTPLLVREGAIPWVEVRRWLQC
jgi:L-threonylcarbamoyladenylate synthase